ncbi:two component, sigma54 specific, transcriptional regulator, Fis family [Tistlia consotensis]|uniref:Two component, sigma54 specific, transcriptional regulator, Fis family n=1 Tax=Tistlia consotensis USBA 355 TaxID=560819 RepID=A0A1Y6CQ83_9PROT|nr:sigma-54 dependent transcriptional regulator [Tistlia consotensis]SMF67626.1 two component, sigma54 specific, transcriptional regulator, Fis family [Tistlia consotensis USBA 355]SNR99763.1 two component, sigma54 specific, transcriptional regulator, Fis family [Tistlia consotensis]
MRLLIVGSLDGHITTAGKIALERGAKVAHVDDLTGALNALRSGQGADLLMVDVMLDVGRLIEALKRERISVPVVACGVKADPARAEAAIRAGAKEYVPLPPDPELIAAVLAAVTEETNAFIFADPAMERSIRLADQIAGSDASVLITGESGTGKEVMARYIHSKSKRASKTFVSVNCAAIPENLLESELFGHEKGAFTGALARRVGKFEEANGGTLLLDEVTEMHPRLQAKLLRAIQEREIDRVGGTQPVKVDIRLLATSNRDLEQAVREGDFREDLYFRLNVVNLELPPLRERPRDVEILSEHFVQKYADANGVPKPSLTPEAKAILRQHQWRGNVRELENTMHRAVLLAQDGRIVPDSILLSGVRLTPERAAPAPSAPAARPTASAAPVDDEFVAFGGSEPSETTRRLVGRTVAEVERDLIIDTLSHCLGNRTHAANILGISIRTLRNKLRQYADEGVPVPMPGEAERSMA